MVRLARGSSSSQNMSPASMSKKVSSPLKTLPEHPRIEEAKTEESSVVTQNSNKTSDSHGSKSSSSSDPPVKPAVAKAVALASAYAHGKLTRKHGSTASTISSLDASTVHSNGSTTMTQEQAASMVVESMLAAMTELQAEVRQKHGEVEALRTTVAALSEALRDADEQLYQSQLEAEKLQLKLQGVTFCEEEHTMRKNALSLKETQFELHAEEPDLSPGSEITTRLPKNVRVRKGTRRTKRRSKTLPKSSLMDQVPSDSEEEFESGDESSTASETDDSSVDDSSDAPLEENEAAALKQKKPKKSTNDSEPSIETAIPSTTSPNPTAPCQKAFYRVIFERDVARQRSLKLGQALQDSQEEIRVLRNRLSKSTALVELAYETEIGDDEGRQPENGRRRTQRRKSPAEGNTGGALKSTAKTTDKGKRSRSEMPEQSRNLNANDRKAAVSWLTKDNDSVFASQETASSALSASSKARKSKISPVKSSAAAKVSPSSPKQSVKPSSSPNRVSSPSKASRGTLKSDSGRKLQRHNSANASSSSPKRFTPGVSARGVQRASSMAAPEAPMPRIETSPLPDAMRLDI